jgi:hypothetical protein
MVYDRREDGMKNVRFEAGCHFITSSHMREGSRTEDGSYSAGNLMDLPGKKYTKKPLLTNAYMCHCMQSTSP